MKFSLIILISLFLSFTANSQVNLQNFTTVFNKNNISDAKTFLQTILKLRPTDTLYLDTLVGNITGGKVKAYIKHKKTNIKFSFTSEALYKSLYKQAEQKLKYTADYARGTRGNGTSRHTTSFSNYEGAKIGSLEVLLVVIRSTDTEKVIGYELLLYPYYED